MSFYSSSSNCAILLSTGYLHCFQTIFLFDLNSDIQDETNEQMSQEKINVLKLFVLCVPWSCNFGGAASLYGTGGNLLLKATLEK